MATGCDADSSLGLTSAMLCGAAQARIDGLVDIIDSCQTREDQFGHIESALHAAQLQIEQIEDSVLQLRRIYDAGQFEHASELADAIAALETQDTIQRILHTYLVILDEQVRAGCHPRGGK